MERDTTTEMHGEGSESGWLSAFQVSQEEAIPLTEATAQLRLAVLALLDRRPHSHGIRAEMGEFVPVS